MMRLAPMGERLRSQPSDASWSDLIRSFAESVGRVGYWTGEALALRNAAGIRRLGRANWSAIRTRLAAGGFEVEPVTVPVESDIVRVLPTGTAAWLRRGQALIEQLDRADEEVPTIATWRAESARDLALHRWAAAMIKADNASEQQGAIDGD
jgi:hypothetical protein